jgi:hypothetical protein
MHHAKKPKDQRNLFQRTNQIIGVFMIFFNVFSCIVPVPNKQVAEFAANYSITAIHLFPIFEPELRIRTIGLRSWLVHPSWTGSGSDPLRGADLDLDVPFCLILHLFTLLLPIFFTLFLSPLSSLFFPLSYLFSYISLFFLFLISYFFPPK